MMNINENGPGWLKVYRNRKKQEAQRNEEDEQNKNP